jgi:Cdc6-like AAA superfamily ATPase
LEQNKSFSLKETKKEKNWESKILYEAYKIESPFSEMSIIYINPRTNQEKTHEYLIKNKIINSHTHLWILIDDESNQDPDGVKRKFNAKEVLSLDKFALKHLYKNQLDADIYYNGSFSKQRQIKNFVEPFTENSNEKNAIIILKEWFTKENQPLMVIKGHGGIGKTTLVKYFLNDLFYKYQDIPSAIENSVFIF